MPPPTTRPSLGTKCCVIQSIGRQWRFAENLAMGEKKPMNVLVRRPPETPAGGDTCENPFRPGEELELVSTQMLKQILSSRDIENRKGVEEAAKAGTDGVLARDPVTGFYVIIGDEELKAIVDSGQPLPKLSKPSDVTATPLHDYADSQNLSLVSIQALRRVFSDEAAESDPEDRDGDFDPYAA